jgi:hypothetical protein
MFRLNALTMKKLAMCGSIIGGAAALTIAQPVFAAPNMELTTLPISPQLASQLTSQGLSDEEIAEFFATLSQVNVYDDHTNPVDVAGRNDPSRPKTYWGAPFFAPSKTRSAVGAEQFSTYALTVLDRVNRTMESFEFPERQFSRLTHLRDGLEEQRTKALADLQKPTNTASQTANLNQLVAVLNEQLAAVNADIQALLAGADQSVNELPLGLRRSIADSVKVQLARIGIVATAQEQALIDNGEIVSALSMMVARAGRGQFGLRQVILESGYTDKQREVLQTYLALRPDITTKGLSVTKVLALPIAQATINEDGQHEVESSTAMIRGVNIGSRGACGNTRSCNVLIEYTDIGARTSSFMPFGTPIALPVRFAAAVRVAEPDFVGSVHCKFRTGWTATGRADVRDGAIIYDGDLTDTLHFESSSSPDSGCQVNIAEGDRNSALYHTLLAIDAEYRQLFGERVRDAKVAKDAYEQSIRTMLAQQQANSQRPRGGLFGDLVGFIGGPFGGFLSGLVRGVTDVFWHTTKLNTSSFDSVEITESYEIRNMTAVSQRDFDGFALVCYEQSGGGLNGVMKACPDADVADPETETGAGEEECPVRNILDQCIP